MNNYDFGWLCITIGFIILITSVGAVLTHEPAEQAKEDIMSNTARVIYKSGEVVGCFYLDATAKDYAEQVPIGTAVMIAREPENQHDPNACAVITITGDHRLGYIPGPVAPAIALFIDAGYTVSGQVTGRVGKRSMGNQPKNPTITLFAEKPQ